MNLPEVGDILAKMSSAWRIRVLMVGVPWYKEVPSGNVLSQSFQAPGYL